MAEQQTENRFQAIINQCEVLKTAGIVPTYDMMRRWAINSSDDHLYVLQAWMHWTCQNVEWLCSKPGASEVISFLVIHLQDSANQIRHEADMLSEIYSDLAEWLMQTHPAVFQEWDELDEDTPWLSS
jgi:hypothetical protein